MRIATWNVNSLKARLEKVTWWLDRAKPDVLFMQETKLSDADAPTEVFRDFGYGLVHHGEGRWNGVAIASRLPIDDVIKDQVMERVNSTVIKRESIERGCRTLRMDGAKKVLSGVTTPAEVLRVTQLDAF